MLPKSLIIDKYQDLNIELKKKQWKMKVPIVVGALGTVLKAQEKR